MAGSPGLARSCGGVPDRMGDGTTGEGPAPWRGFLGFRSENDYMGRPVFLES